MSPRLSIHAITALLLLSAACSRAAERPTYADQLSVRTVGQAAPAEPSASPAPFALTAARARKVGAESSEGAALATFWADQKLIRTAELRIEVKDVEAAQHAADSLARLRGALVADSRTSRDDQDRRQAQLVLRVPSDRLVETINALRALGETREEVVNTQDITKEYADLETRLGVKEQTVKRLRALLDNRTAKLSDVLDVERELARAVTELEQMKGERKYYDQQVALSSLTLTLIDRATTHAGQFTGPVGEAFRKALDVLGRSLASIIYIVTFLVPWTVFAIALWWGVRRLRARRGPVRTPLPTA